MFQAGLWIDDILEQFHPIISLERRKPSEHLMNEASEAPPVDIDPMPFLPDDLRSEVFGSAADCLGLLLEVFQDFRQSEVCQFDVTGLIDDYIFWLQTRYNGLYSR